MKAPFKQVIIIIAISVSAGAFLNRGVLLETFIEGRCPCSPPPQVCEIDPDGKPGSNLLDRKVTSERINPADFF
jgi:hypothetical protein